MPGSRPDLPPTPRAAPAAGLGLPSNDQGLWQGGNHAGERTMMMSLVGNR